MPRGGGGEREEKGFKGGKVRKKKKKKNNRWTKLEGKGGEGDGNEKVNRFATWIIKRQWMRDGKE